MKKLSLVRLDFLLRANFMVSSIQERNTMLAFCNETFLETNGLSFNKNRLHELSAGFEIGFIADYERYIFYVLCKK
jgi:hypothetical protein